MKAPLMKKESRSWQVEGWRGKRTGLGMKAFQVSFHDPWIPGVDIFLQYFSCIITFAGSNALGRGASRQWRTVVSPPRLQNLPLFWVPPVGASQA